MASITKEQVLHLARISRISLHEQEVAAVTEQLQAVLEYAARVNEVATLVQGPLPQNSNVMRDDVVVPFDAQRILQEAPEEESNYFVVPAILEHE